jgi:hypothetical protein
MTLSAGPHHNDQRHARGTPPQGPQVADGAGSVGQGAELHARIEEPHAANTSVPAASEPAPAAAPATALVHQPRHLHPEQKSLFDRVEAFISSLSVRDNFWHSICSLIWLPLAFFSGIKMKQVDPNTFLAILPFRRFNRNWYRAMAGGALLGNAEIAGGMYVFGVCGADYTVVCKHLEYDFLRPCFGPAVYKMTPRENLPSLVATRREFNITLDLEILQQGFRPGERDRRVGRSLAIFHVTPKVHHKIKKLRHRS